MSPSIIQDSEAFVLKLLEKALKPEHTFHSVAHTLEVREAALKIGRKTGISDEELELLELAALFHDVGYTAAYDGHEAESMRMAKDYLSEQNYPEERLQSVLACIEATRFEFEPRNMLESIIRDADLCNLGSDNYLVKQACLRQEWEFFRAEVYSDKEWRKLNRQFFKQHSFHTEAARELFEATKKSNLALMKDSKKKKDNPSKDKSPLASSKSVQLMFKTASRNHIDLTNLADNKANMMLSVNSIIITITLPLLATYLREDLTLLAPAVILLSTCVVSVIYATLATRPINMEGLTTIEQVKAGKSNLFFFGNFYNMGIQQYKAGMKEVISDETILEDSAISDLYYLGAALGKKYRMLRTCYTIFMIGITSTVVVFTVIKILTGF